MTAKLIVSISKSLLMARWRQNPGGGEAIGVTFSITMFIALLGFMEGLNDLLDNLILNRTPYIRLYNEIKPSAVTTHRSLLPAYQAIIIYPVGKTKNQRLEIIYNNGAILQALKADPRVLGIAPKSLPRYFY